MIRTLLPLLLATSISTVVAGPNGKLAFFGGVTDPGLYPGEYQFSWPETLFLSEPYSQATCRDSASEYQIQTGVSSFNGITGLGWKPLADFYSWTRTNRIPMTWYGGYIASINKSWPRNIGITGNDVVTAFTNWVATAASNYPNIEYINIANEPLHGGNSGNVQTAFGGAGTTGYDWIINIAKLFRQYFPKAKLGVNEFQVESTGNDLPYGTDGSCTTMLPQFLTMIQALKTAGVIDWVGLEGYSLETVSRNNLISALDQIGAIVPNIIFTEFSPGAFQENETVKLQAWRSLLPAIVANQYVMGVTGPWNWRKTETENNGWIVDDTVSPESDSPSMTWLKSYVPGILAKSGKQ